MTVVNRSLNNLLCVEIPKGGFYPVNAYFLANKKKVEIIDGGRTKQNNRLYYITVSDKFKSAQPFVIVLEVDTKNKN